jgi:hypothetical protein
MDNSLLLTVRPESGAGRTHAGNLVNSFKPDVSHIILSLTK